MQRSQKIKGVVFFSAAAEGNNAMTKAIGTNCERANESFTANERFVWCCRRRSFSRASTGVLNSC